MKPVKKQAAIQSQMQFSILNQKNEPQLFILQTESSSGVFYSSPYYSAWPLYRLQYALELSHSTV